MPETLDGLNRQNSALAEKQLEAAHKHYTAGAFEDSLRCVRAAMTLTTVDKNAIRSYVLALQDADRHELAVELCEHALAQHPDDDLFWFDLGRSLEELEEFDRAYDAYTRSNELDPRDAMTMNNRAFLELRRGNLDPALRDVDEALVRNPDEGIAHATKAEILAQRGQIDAAYASLARAIELSDEWIDTAIESEFLEPLRRDARWPGWLDDQRRRPR